MRQQSWQMKGRWFDSSRSHYQETVVSWENTSSNNDCLWSSLQFTYSCFTLWFEIEDICSISSFMDMLLRRKYIHIYGRAVASFWLWFNCCFCRQRQYFLGVDGGNGGTLLQLPHSDTAACCGQTYSVIIQWNTWPCTTVYVSLYACAMYLTVYSCCASDETQAHHRTKVPLHGDHTGADEGFRWKQSSGDEWHEAGYCWQQPWKTCCH